MTNALHPNDHQVITRHYDSMMASLGRRLEVAKANNNATLIALLEREKQQVALDATPANLAKSHPSPLQVIAQRLMKTLFGGSELQVSEIVDGSDRWWVASDPRTGQFVYADSEAELRLWIEENYRGK